MTNTRTTAIIRAEIAENALQFTKSREDAILFERLKAAAAKATALAAKGNELSAELLRAEEREDRERRDAQYANIRNMRVQVVNGEPYSPSPLAAKYIIRFEQLTYSSSYHQNVWEPREIAGFDILTPDQFGYLVEKAPDQIPQGIMALAPGNPVEAFRIYSLGMRRGFLAA